MKNEKTNETIEIQKRIHFSTNNGCKIFGAFAVNLSQFLTVKNDLIYFLTAENNVVWCDLEMFEKIFTRYLKHDITKLPKALADARAYLILTY